MQKKIITLLLLVPLLAFGQLKKDLQKPDFSNYLKYPANKSLLGFLDPNKLEMHHSFSMSYSSFGGHGVMLNTYVNTMQYRFNDAWQLTTNLGIMGSPYNSLPNAEFLNKNQIFGGAELKYRPTENSIISLKFESLPYQLYRPSPFYYDRYGSSFDQ